MLVALSGCAGVDTTRPVDGSLGLPFLVFGVYSQPQGMVSRWALADELERDMFIAEELGAYDAFTGIGVFGVIAGLGTGTAALAIAANPRESEDKAIALGVTAGVLLAVGFISDFIARLYLDGAIDAHNEQLTGLQTRPTPDARDPDLPIGRGDLDEKPPPVGTN